MGFNEGRMLANIDRKRSVERIERERALRQGTEISPVIAQVHNRLTKDIFSSREYAVQAPDFYDVYGKEAVINDMREVLRLRAEFKKNETPESEKSHKLAEVFEGLVLVNAKQNKWFGNAALYKTSAYDDIKNKTDMYGEWRDENNRSHVLALAVDLTFSQQGGANKLDYIKRSIERGELGKIKYFKDATGNVLGTRLNVPRVVVGVGSRELAELASLWILNKHQQLAEHPVRDMMIHEMHTQLTGMEQYAKKLGKKDIADAYAEALAVVEPLHKANNERIRQATDPVLKSIEDKMRSFS